MITHVMITHVKPTAKEGINYTSVMCAIAIPFRSEKVMGIIGMQVDIQFMSTTLMTSGCVTQNDIEYVACAKIV